MGVKTVNGPLLVTKSRPLTWEFVSGWRDLNPRPLRPELPAVGLREVFYEVKGPVRVGWRSVRLLWLLYSAAVRARGTFGDGVRVAHPRSSIILVSRALRGAPPPPGVGGGLESVRCPSRPLTSTSPAPRAAETVAGQPRCGDAATVCGPMGASEIQAPTAPRGTATGHVPLSNNARRSLVIARSSGGPPSRLLAVGLVNVVVPSRRPTRSQRPLVGPFNGG